MIMALGRQSASSGMVCYESRVWITRSTWFDCVNRTSLSSPFCRAGVKTVQTLLARAAGLMRVIRCRSGSPSEAELAEIHHCAAGHFCVVRHTKK